MLLNLKKEQQVIYSNQDMNNKITRYKFGSGDIVGLFEYTDRLLYTFINKP